MTAVEAQGLVKHYPSKGGAVEAVRGVDLRVERRRGVRLPRPERGGEVDHREDAHHAALDHRGQRPRRRCRRRRRPRRGAPPDRRRAAGGRARPAPDRPRADRPAGAACSALSAAEAPARADELLALVELEDAADRSIKGYSGGMKRRLDLASALVHEPEVLFLDEPTTGLDPASRLTVWEEVRRINERGTTVFLTTQYLEEADPLCDRLAIIDGGLIVREGTPASAQARAAGAPRARRRSDARRRLPRRDRPHPRAGRGRRAGGDRHEPGLAARAARAARGLADAGGAASPRCSSRCSSSSSTSARRRRSSPASRPRSCTARATARSSSRPRCCWRRSFGTAALFLVEEIEGGYFDKLRATPIPRTSIVLGRLIAEAVKGVVIATAI